MSDTLLVRLNIGTFPCLVCYSAGGLFVVEVTPEVYGVSHSCGLVVTREQYPSASIACRALDAALASGIDWSQPIEVLRALDSAHVRRLHLAMRRAALRRANHRGAQHRRRRRTRAS